MCTVVLLLRPGHPWPVMLAANRDERIDRPWDPPREFWPGVIGGRDRSAGGTWMALNRHGVVAAVLNRVGTLGPAPGKRSRGELPLIALAKPTAAEAAEAVLALDAGHWRTFNLVLADRHGAVVIRGLGAGRPEAIALAPGAHMVTAHDVDDIASPRTARHLPRFRAAPAPEPASWGAWQAILADASGPVGTELNVPLRAGFGTVSAALMAIPAEGPPEWRFAAGRPDVAPFTRVDSPVIAA